MSGNKKNKFFLLPVFLMLIVATLSCTLPFSTVVETPTLSPTLSSTETLATQETSNPENLEVIDITSSPTKDDDAACSYGAHFIMDVTIPDGSPIAPGDSFSKTWRMENNGCLDWPTGTKLFFVQGDQLGGPTSVDVPFTAVGGQRDITVGLVGPAVNGEFRGYWQLKSPDGILFGPKVYLDILVTVYTPGPSTSGPDLTITNLDPNIEIEKDTPFTFNIRVVNQGDSAAGATTLSCELIGQGVNETKSVWALGAGESMIVTCGYTLGVGDYTFRATLDSGNTVAESNETNNIRTYTFTVSEPFIIVFPTIQFQATLIFPMFQPDLVVTSITLVNNQHIQVQVRNQGNSQSAETEVRCNIFTSGMQFHSEKTASIGILGAGIGTVTTCYMNIPIPISSIEAISAVIDPQNLITESDETNNIRWIYP